MLKKILKWVGLLILLGLVAGGAFVGYHVSQYEASMAKVWDIPVPTNIVASKDLAVIERGKHLAESLGGCAIKDCHGPDLSGGHVMDMGPLGSMSAANITPGGVAATYSDGEIARLIMHGVKRDGHAARFMPSKEFCWWPEDDIAAVISYVRSVPLVQKPDGRPSFSPMAKMLDRLDKLEIDHARRIDHQNRPIVPRPEPTASYGMFVGRLCLGCHGAHLSGGPIPGAPPSFAIPLNLTPHETGLKGWTFADFERVLDQGIRKNGQKLNPFMPIEALSKMNAVERQALWAYLQSLPPSPFGRR